MTPLYQTIIALVLLGLGALFYFISRKSQGKPRSDDSDPFEDVEPESIEPAKTTLAVSDEPDENVEPEVIITSTKPVPEDEPVQPTPNTTPAKPLIPATKVTISVVTQPIEEPYSPDSELPVQPTPNTTPAKPLIPATKVTTPVVIQSPQNPNNQSKKLSEFRRGWPNGTKWNIRGATGNDTQRCHDICKSLGYNYFTHNPPPADGGCGCFKSALNLSQLSMTDHDNAKTRRVV
jgi:hypothetical protein